MILIASRIVRDLVGRLIVPLLEIGVLVLEGMRELVGHYLLLLVGIHPIEQVHGLGFGVVEGLDLLFEKGEKKWLEGKVAVEQAEFLQHDLVALQTLGAFILVELLFQIGFNRRARDQLAFDGAFDGQPRLVGRELDEHVDHGEELLGLFGRNAGCGLGGGTAMGRCARRARRRRRWSLLRRRIGADRKANEQSTGTCAPTAIPG